MQSPCRPPQNLNYLETIEELRAIEHQVEREWWWLNGALNTVAQVQAERAEGSLLAFRQMQAQEREVDRRRVEIAVRMAQLLAGLDEHS